MLPMEQHDVEVLGIGEFAQLIDLLLRIDIAMRVVTFDMRR